MIKKIMQKLRRKDFVVKVEDLSRKKKRKRIYLNDDKTQQLMKRVNVFFNSYIDIPRIQIGKQKTVETLINDEALLFSKYLRNERKRWIPRMLS